MRTMWQMWVGALNPKVIDKIASITKDIPYEKAKTFNEQTGDEQNEEVRRSQIKWLTDDAFVRGLLWGYVQEANRIAFGFDVQPVGHIQYTEYDAKNKGHYDWHHDIDWTGNAAYDRKLSVTVQLSDPNDYEGGTFEFSETNSPNENSSRNRGTIIVFPSYLKHRVLPVTSGNRKSLVAWFEGPRWR